MKIAAVFLTLLLGLCQGANIVEILRDEHQETILSLLEMTGLTDTLEGEGPWTVFVPKQEVFDSLPEELIEAIVADVDALTQTLLYHVVIGEAPIFNFANEHLLPTAQGSNLRINLYQVDGESVIAVGGVPVDAEQADIQADNGLITYLDFIILSIPIGTSVDSLPLVEGASFDALLYALEQTNHMEIVNEVPDITLLAPVDSDIFNVAVVDSLLADPDALTAILYDHAVTGTIFSVGLGSRDVITTLGGNTVVVEFTSDHGYVISDVDGNIIADVIAGDIATTQGVLHIIDRPIIL